MNLSSKLTAAVVLLLVGGNVAQADAAAAKGFVTIAQVPITAEQVVVMAESAQVKIVRSAEADKITVTTNCPHNWNVKGGTVRQAGFAKVRGGVAMMADALGSRAIVNGKVYIMPEGPIRGISMGKDGVTAGGQKLQPLEGTDMPGSCGDAPDSVEVMVPDSYKGDLMIGMGSESSATVDSWSGGKVECTLMGNSTLNAAKLKSLSKAVLDLRGDGKAEIGDLSTKVLVANVTGNGKVIVKNGNADISNATIAGNGSIQMKGKYGDLKKSVMGGQGKIEVSE
jgi:hypothetical protein